MGPKLDVHALTDIAEKLHDSPTPTHTAEQVVSYAMEQLEADHGGITLLQRGGKLETIAPSDALVEQADRLQDELEEGVCSDVSWHGETLMSRDLAADSRWPHWAPAAGDLGIASVLATELNHVNGKRLGTMNMYWASRRSFTADDVAFAELFTRHAALAITTTMHESGLHKALDSRKLIGQAQGILMERHDLDADSAFDVLKRYSQDYNVKMREVAEQFVATRRLPSD